MKSLKRVLLQLLMIKRILSFVFNPVFTTLINSVPAFKDACDALQAMADGMDQKIAEYKKVIKGITIDKRNARTALAQISYTVMSAVKSYAIQIGNNDLAQQMSVSASDLKYMPYQPLVIKITDAISVVQPLLSSLTDYNITATTITQWQAALDTMNEKLNSSEIAIRDRKTFGSIASTDMKSIMDFFNNQLSPLAASFISTPEFYIGFQNNKRIGIGAIHHTRLNALVQDELGNPFYGIVVRVDAFTDPDTGRIYEPVIAITNSTGNATVSEFFPGERTVTVSGNGIEQKTFPAIIFTSGNAVQQTFIGTPDFNNVPAPTPAQPTENTPG